MDAYGSYLLGAMGDAHVDYKRGELFFHQKNREWLEYINQLLNHLFGFTGRIFKQDVFCLRKKSKVLISQISELQQAPIANLSYFFGGLFDSEGSISLSSKSKIPVIDITQCIKGLRNIELAKEALDSLSVKNYINGPYNHKHAKLLQYHIRVYGVENCKKIFNSCPILHPEKSKKFKAILGL